MQFGYCANLNFLLNNDELSKKIFYAVLEASYDYIETPLSSFLLITSEQRKRIESDMKSAHVPCCANFLLFPHDLPLVGNMLDLEKIKTHAKNVLPGTSRLVFDKDMQQR